MKNTYHVTADSRHVQPDGTFVAISGTQLDGRLFIADAIARGAKTIVLALPKLDKEQENIKYIYIENPRLELSKLAAQCYPQQPQNMVAVTGTNGKSSVAYFYNQIATICGYKSASIGTIGVYVGMQQTETDSLTSPDAVALHQLLSKLQENGITHAALEASSHGLDQHRLDSVTLKAAAFTNITPDHLDYHPDFKSYFAAKKRLFSEILPPNGIAVLNADIEHYAELAALCAGCKVLSYGYAGNAIRLLNKQAMKLHIKVLEEEYHIDFPLLGDFQVANALCALGLAIATDITPHDAVHALSQLQPAPGRLELIATHNNAKIIMDYAHTGDALSNVLRTLRQECSGKLHVLFGSGGNRDPRRRQEMGIAAQRYADYIVVTDDNPREEDPALIRQQILQHCPNAVEIADRQAAINYAVQQLQPQDILAVVGKGHENYQIIGKEKLPFSDKEAVFIAISLYTHSS